MQFSRASRMLALFLLCPVGLAQQNAGPASASSSSHPTGKSRAPRLTPEQERGLRLLKAALARAAGLQPEVRSFVLWQAANGYAKVDAAKAHALLRQAFDATESMESASGDGSRCRNFGEPCHTQSWLQTSILLQILQVSPDEVRDLLPKAQAETRDEVTRAMIAYYAEHKNFDGAKELLDQFAGERDYPYWAAAELMLTLPEARSADRLAIFSQALTNYCLLPDDGMPHLEDFATLVVRFWRDLPPAMVSDAIDAILSRSKDSGEMGNQVKVTISAQKGDVDFANVYQLRLFELLPIIEELDKSKAESLLRENADTASIFGRYPMGLQSLGKYRSRGNARNDILADGIFSVAYSRNQDPAQAAMAERQMREQAELNKRSDEIDAEARENPRQAIADAMLLPLIGPPSDPTPRLGCLSYIATRAAKSAPSIARNALEEQGRGLDGVPPESQGGVVLEMLRNYLLLNDEDGARGAVKRALKVAQKLYERDTDADDPSVAFKGFWPSTNLWRELLREADHISPKVAEEILGEIPDPDIRAMERVLYADSWLGVTSSYPVVIHAYKKDAPGSAWRE